MANHESRDQSARGRGARTMTLEGVADRFAREQLGCSLDAFPMGAEGMKALARALDAWCEVEDPGDEADRAFVEGAGALLGLLLIAHIGDGAHVERGGKHLVRLGPRGWFDPFAAIEEALDAEDPRAALAARVRRAEAEARDRGPTSRVLYAIERELAAAPDAPRVAEHFEHYVRLEPEGELDIARIVSATEGQPDAAVDQAVQKLLGMLGGTSGDVTWDEARPLLFPRLVPSTFLEEVHGAHPGRGRIFARTVSADVACTLVLHYEDRARYARTDEVARWEEASSSGAPLHAALENLAARSARARFARVDTAHGPLVVARTGDGLDAARLILPTLHDVLAPELGSPFVAAVPHRDTLLACARAPRALVEALRARAEDDASRAPHRITAALFEVGANALRAIG